MIRDCAHEALEDLREVIGVLRVSPADESRRAGMRVLLESEVAGVVPAVVDRSAYRAVQEGLTNARKHARGSDVSVTVRGVPGDGLTVEIRNPAGSSIGVPA